MDHATSSYDKAGYANISPAKKETSITDLANQLNTQTEMIMNRCAAIVDRLEGGGHTGKPEGVKPGSPMLYQLNGAVEYLHKTHQVLGILEAKLFGINLVK